MAAMGAAGATYRLVRLAALSRLAVVPNAGLLTRGLGARTLASSLAFAAEGAVFPAVHHLAAPQADGAGFGDQVLSSYCVLGGLRLAAFAGAGLTRGRALGWGAGFLRQGTMLGGILLGSGLEKSLGLRAEAPWSSTLAQSFATLLHFNAAGALFRGLSGARFQAWERGVDLQIQKLESGLPLVHGLNPSLAGPRLAQVSAGGLVWRMADGGNDGKPMLPGQTVPPLTLTFDEALAPKSGGGRVPEPQGRKTYQKTGKPKSEPQQPVVPASSPESVILTLVMAGSPLNKQQFEAEMPKLPEKLEGMSEAQLKTVVELIVTHIIKNPLSAESGGSLKPDLIKSQQALLLNSFKVLQIINNREGSALRSATYSALLSLLDASSAIWMKGTVRQEIQRALREGYTAKDAAALVDHVSKMLPLLGTVDRLAVDYLQFLRSNLSVRQRKVFLENLVAGARSLTEASQVNALVAVLYNHLPDVLLLLRKGDGAPSGYFKFLREHLAPQARLRTLTQRLIDGTEALPTETQKEVIGEIENNFNALNRLERDVILTKLRPKGKNPIPSKLSELYFDLQSQFETKRKETSRPPATAPEIGVEGTIMDYLFEPTLREEPPSGIQERPTTPPPAPASERAASGTSRRPSVTPGLVARWGRVFEFNPEKVSLNDMAELDGMLTNWVSSKKPPDIVGKALIGVRERHPDAEMRQRADELIKAHGLESD
ncbi:MAG TPA: hypothetical protein VFW62_12065, partial [bacterium]|nr:hypothetical protein [bacterium]